MHPCTAATDSVRGPYHPVFGSFLTIHVAGSYSSAGVSFIVFIPAPAHNKKKLGLILEDYNKFPPDFKKLSNFLKMK